MKNIELNKGELLCWLSWLRKQAKEAKIWSGMNDEIAHEQVRQLIERVPEESLITKFRNNPTLWMKYLQTGLRDEL